MDPIHAQLCDRHNGQTGVLKMTDMKMMDQIAGHENAGHEIARHEIARHDKYLYIVVSTNPRNFSSIVKNLM